MYVYFCQHNPLKKEVFWWFQGALLVSVIIVHAIALNTPREDMLLLLKTKSSVDTAPHTIILGRLSLLSVCTWLILCTFIIGNSSLEPLLVDVVWSKICADAMSYSYWFVSVLITCDSNLVPSLEGLCTSNPYRFEFSVLWFFAGIEPMTSGLTLWPTKLVLHRLGLVASARVWLRDTKHQTLASYFLCKFDICSWLQNVDKSKCHVWNLLNTCR